MYFYFIVMIRAELVYCFFLLLFVVSHQNTKVNEKKIMKNLLGNKPDSDYQTIKTSITTSIANQDGINLSRSRVTAAPSLCSCRTQFKAQVRKTKRLFVHAAILKYHLMSNKLLITGFKTSERTLRRQFLCLTSRWSCLITEKLFVPLLKRFGL